MAQFEYRIVENEIQFRIAGWSHAEEFLWLEEINVTYSDLWASTICFHADKEMFEEDPREYDEEGKENMRKLLRQLGYKRMPLWVWKR